MWAWTIIQQCLRSIHRLTTSDMQNTYLRMECIHTCNLSKNRQLAMISFANFLKYLLAATNLPLHYVSEIGSPPTKTLNWVLS